MLYHKLQQYIFTLIFGTPGKAAVGGNTARNRDDPSVSTAFLADFFHGHGCRCGIEGKHKLFCFLNHTLLQSMRFCFAAASAAPKAPAYRAMGWVVTLVFVFWERT